MNFLEFMESYRDILIQTINIWKNAIIKKSCDAENEIKQYLARITDKMVSFEESTTFYRARIVSKNDYNKIVLTNEPLFSSSKTGINGFMASEMGAPPKEKVKGGRANKEGCSYLYLASDKATACAEVQPVCDDLISVAPFRLKQSLKLVDLRNFPDDFQEFTDKDSLDKLIDFVFCQELISFFSMPVKSGDEEMYRFSQYVSDCFLQNDLQGILYNSSHNNNSNSFNLVIFDSSKATCISEYGEAFKCLSTSSTFQSVSKNYFQLDEIEIISSKKEIDPYLWNTTAVLYRDISEIARGKGNNKNETQV